MEITLLKECPYCSDGIRPWENNKKCTECEEDIYGNRVVLTELGEEVANLLQTFYQLRRA